MVIKSVPSKNYNREYYALCGGHKAFFKGEISECLNYAFRLAEIRRGMRVLDIGAGRGELAVKCAQAGATVMAIDYSQAAVEIALNNLASRVDKKVARKVTYKRMNAKKIAYQKNYFNVVFMNDVVEHLYPEELKKVFLEIRRVIKPEGKLIIHTPNVGLIKPVCFLAKIFFNWQPPKEHVNEQSWFSLRQELKIFKKSRVYLRPRKRYFSEPVGLIKDLPSWSSQVASFLDNVWENKIMAFIIYHTPLSLILGTDLWAVAKA